MKKMLKSTLDRDELRAIKGLAFAAQNRYYSFNTPATPLGYVSSANAHFGRVFFMPFWGVCRIFFPLFGKSFSVWRLG